MLKNGEVVSKEKAKYKLDTNSNVITMYMENFSFTFDIIKLSDEIMEVENQLTKKIDRYIRF